MFWNQRLTAASRADPGLGRKPPDRVDQARNNECQPKDKLNQEVALCDSPRDSVEAAGRANVFSFHGRVLIAESQSHW